MVGAGLVWLGAAALLTLARFYRQFLNPLKMRNVRAPIMCPRRATRSDPSITGSLLLTTTTYSNARAPLSYVLPHSC